MSAVEVSNNKIESETERPFHRAPPPPPSPSPSPSLSPTQSEPISPFQIVEKESYGTFILSIYLIIFNFSRSNISKYGTLQ